MELAPPSSAIRVLVVDDHHTIREALSFAFADTLDIHLCGQATTAAEALAAINATVPDVVVLDLMLGDAYGLELMQTLRSLRPCARFVLFSMFDEKVYAERALRSGALAYVMKSAPTRDVLQAIRSAHQGRVHLSDRMASSMLQRLRHDTTQPGTTVDTLSDREVAVLQLLGQGCSVDVISDRLHLSRKTVEAYRRHAAEKLGFDDFTALMHFAVHWVAGHAVPA